VGQIPANWSQGSGTIVSGTAANKATEAALAAYPGGVGPCRRAEERRLQRPLHRSQLAAPRLPQPGLQGHRRRVVASQPARSRSHSPIPSASHRRWRASRTRRCDEHGRQGTKAHLHLGARRWRRQPPDAFLTDPSVLAQLGPAPVQ
jgi:hypothetical protein